MTELPPAGEITTVLRAWSQGDAGALDRLMPLVYGDLHRIAQRQLREERADHILQPTALIHEAYIRLLEHRHPNWESRLHFYGAVAELMRRVLVDLARKRDAQKRGSTMVRVDLAEAGDAVAEQEIDFEALDQALERLARLDRREARIVELRFFGGLSLDDTAKVLGLSRATVKREWALAKAWLLRELGGGD